jgi:hypothetical protein
MNVPKLFLTLSVLLFASIGSLALVKQKQEKSPVPEKKSERTSSKQEIDPSLLSKPSGLTPISSSKQATELPLPAVEMSSDEQPLVIEHDDEPEALAALFVKGSNCPIVKTIRYKSRVPWKSGRSAWLIDYAKHYKTPLDFIYRSIHNGEDKIPSSIADGVEFNVYRDDVDFRFHLLVSLSSCTMRMYYVLQKEKKVVFLKSYRICVGRKSSQTTSGYLTPMGLFQLGPRVAVFKPNMMGPYKGKRVELIQIFGSHWIPFEKEISDCSEPAKGYGIHGTPMVRNAKGEIEEQIETIGGYHSDGCIRLSGKEMKELFAVISTRKTYIEIVSSFQQSRLLCGKI